MLTPSGPLADVGRITVENQKKYRSELCRHVVRRIEEIAYLTATEMRFELEFARRHRPLGLGRLGGSVYARRPSVNAVGHRKARFSRRDEPFQTAGSEVLAIRSARQRQRLSATSQSAALPPRTTFPLHGEAVSRRDRQAAPQGRAGAWPGQSYAQRAAVPRRVGRCDDRRTGPGDGIRGEQTWLSSPVQLQTLDRPIGTLSSERSPSRTDEIRHRGKASNRPQGFDRAAVPNRASPLRTACLKYVHEGDPPRSIALALVSFAKSLNGRAEIPMIEQRRC